MRKRTIIMFLTLLAALSLIACEALPSDALGPSVGATAPGSSRSPDTGFAQEASSTKGSSRATAESPGETADDASAGDESDSADASGQTDTAGVPAFRDGSVEPEKPHRQASGDGSDKPEPDKNPYWIDADVTAQRVTVFRDDEVVKTMVCSTGVEGHETPLGTFEIQNRGEWFFNQKYQQGAKYWVSFKDWGVYLFHSLAMDRNQEVIPEEAAKLGQPASHGCIRLSIEDAKWIYENIPARTKVVIHE